MYNCAVNSGHSVLLYPLSVIHTSLTIDATGKIGLIAILMQLNIENIEWSNEVNLLFIHIYR